MTTGRLAVMRNGDCKGVVPFAGGAGVSPAFTKQGPGVGEEGTVTPVWYFSTSSEPDRPLSPPLGGVGSSPFRHRPHPAILFSTGLPSAAAPQGERVTMGHNET
jgi:hypothetical protein